MSKWSSVYIVSFGKSRNEHMRRNKDPISYVSLAVFLFFSVFWPTIEADSAFLNGNPEYDTLVAQQRSKAFHWRVAFQLGRIYDIPLTFELICWTHANIQVICARHSFAVQWFICLSCTVNRYSKRAIINAYLGIWWEIDWLCLWIWQSMKVKYGSSETNDYHILQLKERKEYIYRKNNIWSWIFIPSHLFVPLSPEGSNTDEWLFWCRSASGLEESAEGI
jgi:hypothetical protein